MAPRSGVEVKEEEGESQKKISVLFVCLGNICRSTMGEGVFRSLTLSEGSPYKRFVGRVDSCGTGGYHTGDEPDSRTMSTLEDHGITDYRHAARTLRSRDFKDFDYIFCMDHSNLEDAQRWANRPASKDGAKAQVMLFGEFSGVPGKKERVSDPYYGGRDGFEKAYEQCRRFSINFLKEKLPNVPGGEEFLANL
ncbi:phosphotyrosine protein phosphatase I superfamily [Microdochium trichocladiopsis]|uniref:Phosphotyrosine protein phosphatase I superfamily n=1 Tax=Microdochium trichocladiopsis TaxID=1682393 RepID=A0A9P8Y223_9PEZI|nr:phosphotyrosine protein phosphatase I superfamily [Microdochium trichocladiopsis]KAH7025747.1 phosphotyrosine protein phosphatase I superfamily [Microdochium trichocladiopsis]